MKIRNTSYRGEAPRITPRALPEGAAQEAINCRLKRGDIEPWRQFAETATLTGISNPATIFRLKATTWLAFSQQTDIARAAVSGGLDNRVLLTCPELYPTPRYTDFTAATSGAEPYPAVTYPLGVPAPEDPPTLELGVDSTPTTFSIDVLDEGDVLDDQWVTSPHAQGGGLHSDVAQVGSGGNPGSCYRLRYDESQPGAGPYAYRKVDTAPATLIIVTADFKFDESDDDATRRAGLAVAVNGEGLGCAAQVFNGNGLRIVNQADKAGWYGAGIIDTVACPLSYGVWYTFEVTMKVNENGTQTVTAKVLSGVTEIATVTATAVFDVGDYVGINAASGSDAGSFFATLFDNIHVQASGSTGLTPNLTAVNYVYTFVNNLGEEGAPSFPTTDVLRPDGVAVTVTTSTAAPVVASITYTQVTLKRIYRLVSGTTGDVYRLVAEIALATATFVDDLPDSELPQTLLESEDFDLPHPDMEGIISLPNGLCAGFFENQLCISATGWCHAWPVRQRLRVDSEIVAISNIDNTVVIGTKTFVYTATGNDGASYSMSKPGAAQSCTSKLGMVFLDGQGVIFPSPDGWCVCAGSAGNVPVVSEGIFTKEQWTANNPYSIIAAVHDNVLHWYWETSEPAPAETVLFLFHMTETVGEEGIAEFTGATTAVDQTGATWATVGSSPDWDLVATPTPQFGAFSLRFLAGLTWVRDASQTEYSTASVSVLQIDAWVYIRPTGDPGALSIQVGAASYPFPPSFSLDVSQTGAVSAGFDDASEETRLSESSMVAGETWTHLRLLVVGSSLYLYVNGGQVTSSPVTTVNPDPIGSLSAINSMTITSNGTRIMLDDARALIGGSSSTDNFTPPVAPWPNP